MPDLSTFAMPSRLQTDEETLTDTYARFIAEPLEKGFGNTLGNALRRVLLSSLEGCSIAWLKIDGVPHEFYAMDSVIEDVTDIVLNFKKLLFECSGELPRRLELRVDRDGDVTGADIACDSVTRIINPEQHLLTIDKPREVLIEFELTEGRGYRTADDNKSEDHPIGVIPLDCHFSPIRRVAYSVHDCRVGMRTDYDRLEVEVWTDGRLAPQDALRDAAQILQAHLGIFTGVDIEERKAAAPLISSPEDQELLRRLLTSVTDLKLSVRAQNCLNNANIRTVGELVLRSEPEMLKYRNFGQKSLGELKEQLAEMELHLGMELKEEVRVAFETELERMNVGA